ncbi:cyclase [Candidatus Magnetomorum sp. HK-1]|nr:cyclase [Candidatus Magnetomorum sp. HK-1]
MQLKIDTSNGNQISIDVNDKKLAQEKLQVFTQDEQTQTKGKRKRFVGVLLIPAPPEKIWSVLEDFDLMGEFIPHLEYYKTRHVLKKYESGKTAEALVEGKLKVPVLTVEYTLFISFFPDRHRVEWRLVQADQVAEYKNQGIDIKACTGGLKDVDGYGFVLPYEDGSKSIYIYAPIVEASIPLPGFAEKMVTKTVTAGYMHGIRDRVKKLGYFV